MTSNVHFCSAVLGLLVVAIGASVGCEVGVDARSPEVRSAVLDAAPTVHFESRKAFSDGVLVDEERWLAQDAAEATSSALGLQPAVSSDRFWMESVSEEVDGTDAETGIVVNRASVLSAAKQMLSVEERIALIAEMEIEGAIDPTLHADLMLRMAERRSRAPRAALSTYAQSFIEALAPDSLTPVVLCGPAATRAMIPEWTLYNEIVHGFDRAAAREVVEARREVRRAAAAIRQDEIIEALPESTEVDRVLDLPCLHTDLNSEAILEISTHAAISHVYVGVEAVTSGDEEANGVQARQGIQARSTSTTTTSAQSARARRTTSADSPSPSTIPG